MKKLVLFSILLFMLMACIGVLVYIDSHNWAPTDFKITYLQQKNAEIPQNFDDVSILFIGDLEYGDYFDSEKLQLLEDTLSTLDCDIILFSGDLIDEDYSPISDDVARLSEFLKNLDARLGKFCVLGDFDLSGDTRNALVNRILKAGDFEVISGVRTLYNDSANSFINLAGYSYGETVQNQQNFQGYGIVLVHGTSQIDNIDDTVDLILSGHAHEWQINSPFKKHDYSLYENGRLYITSGVGMTKRDARLFCDPEIVFIRLQLD